MPESIDRIAEELERKKQEVADLELALKMKTMLSEYDYDEIGRAGEIVSRLGHEERKETIKPAERHQDNKPALPLPGDNGHAKKTTYAGLTIEEASKAILAESKSALYYSTIADLAMDGGYRGRQDSTPDTIRLSFSQTLLRLAKKGKGIAKVGEGKFVLTAQ